MRYLSVGPRTITAEEQQITLPSTEDQLRQFFQQAPDFSETQPQLLILPDRQNNALLIRGTEAQLQLVEELLVLWDQPSPLIRIEAHIFETTEKISRKLGLRWRALVFLLMGTCSGRSRLWSELDSGPLIPVVVSAHRCCVCCKSREKVGCSRVLLWSP